MARLASSENVNISEPPQQSPGFSSPEEETGQVFAIDDAMLCHEFLALMDTRLFPHEPELKSTPVFPFLGFEQTNAEFLRLFYKLTESKGD